MTFVRADTEIIKVSISRWIEKLEITFPKIFTTGELYPDAKIELSPKSSDTYNHEFVVPLYDVSDDTYELVVRATKGDKVLTVYPKLTVRGSVLDRIRTVIKSYP